jgi:hypothetical protein
MHSFFIKKTTLSAIKIFFYNHEAETQAVKKGGGAFARACKFDYDGI